MDEEQRFAQPGDLIAVEDVYELTDEGLAYLASAPMPADDHG